MKRCALGLLTIALLFVACTATTDTPTAVPTAAVPTENETTAVPPTVPPATAATEAAVPTTNSETAVAEPEPAPSDRPAWQTYPLTDVSSGETFTLADFSDKVIIFETMAVWCPLCTQQQEQIKSALDELGDGVIAISIDIDPSEDAEILSRHVAQQGLTWRFAVADSELATMLQNQYGPVILTPPSTPILIIAPDGKVTTTPPGIKGWDQLVSFAQANLP